MERDNTAKGKKNPTLWFPELNLKDTLYPLGLAHGPFARKRPALIAHNQSLGPYGILNLAIGELAEAHEAVLNGRFDSDVIHEVGDVATYAKTAWDLFPRMNGSWKRLMRAVVGDAVEIASRRGVTLMQAHRSVVLAKLEGNLHPGLFQAISNERPADTSDRARRAYLASRYFRGAFGDIHGNITPEVVMRVIPPLSNGYSPEVIDREWITPILNGEIRVKQRE